MDLLFTVSRLSSLLCENPTALEIRQIANKNLLIISVKLNFVKIKKLERFIKGINRTF